MKRKTTIALLFVGIIMLPLLFSGGLQAFQQYIKYSVEERLNEGELVTVSIPLGRVQWMEEGREILVNEKMFDIKSYYEKNGNLIATGIYDERETAVMELLNHFNDSQQNHFLIQLLLLAQTFVSLVNLIIHQATVLHLLKHHSFFILQKTAAHLLRFYPPPRNFYN